MKAIRDYRKKLDSIFQVVVMFDPLTIKERAEVKEALQHWDADFFKRAYGWAQYYSPLDEIKEDLEGDCPDTKTLKRRLDYVFKEIGQFGNSIYFGLLPTAADKELLSQLTDIKGEKWAKEMCELVYELRTQANRITNEVKGYLHQQCKECGYMLQNTAPEPQQVIHKPTRGRPQKPLKDMMVNDEDGSKLQKIHTLMKGKYGKDAALIILASIKKGWMTKPTYIQVKNEFGDIGSKSGYNNYLNKSKFAPEEIEGAMASLG